MNSPTTLKAGVEASKDFDAFTWMLPNFLDGFYHQPDSALLEEEPPLVTGRMEQGEVIDAYVAATAETLARQFRFPVPKWVFGAGRICEEPFFTMHTPAGRAFVLAYTPAAFKNRQLFVGVEPLSRV
jgi:hypothetical protein